MTAIRYTRNKMHKILENTISDCYEWKESWNKYHELEFDIIPIDFSAFPQIKPDTAKYIDAHFDKEETDKNGNYMLRGFISDNIEAWYRDKEKLNLNYAPYGFYYSGFGFNDAEMIIYTWCEGDTTVTMFNDREKYLKERAETEKWYEENI